MITSIHHTYKLRKKINKQKTEKKTRNKINEKEEANEWS